MPGSLGMALDAILVQIWDDLWVKLVASGATGVKAPHRAEGAFAPEEGRAAKGGGHGSQES